MSARSDGARQALAALAHKGSEHTSDALAVNAFFTRYGTAAEIAERIQHVAGLREFLTKHVGERVAHATEDGAALDALEVVEGRLRELHDRAEQHEYFMGVTGWRLDERDGMKHAPPKTAGRKTRLLTLAVKALFNRMLVQGWPRSNSKEAQEHIRAELLALGVDPTLATKAGIDNAINTVLNPNRHY